MAPRPPLSRFAVGDTTWKVGRLAACPLLLGLSEADCVRLAEAMLLAEYPREHFFGGDEDPDPPPLRLLVTGTVVLAQSFAAEHGRRLLRPGDLFGLESIAARLFPHRSQGVDTFGAHTVDPVRCLELHADAYEAIFGRDPTVEPLRSIVNAWALSIWTPLASRALREVQELSALRQDQILALLARATVVLCEDGDLVPDVVAGVAPDALYVLLEGRLDRVAADRGPSWGWIDPGQVIGLNELFDREPIGYALRARGRARLLRVSSAALRAIAASEPGFLRAVVQAVGKARLFEDELTPLRSTRVVAVLSASGAIPEPVGAPVGLLARAIAEDFHEDVLLVRVAREPREPRDGEALEAPAPWEKNPDNAGGAGAVREVWIDVARLDHDWLASWILSYWDVALIDGSALGPITDDAHPLVAALARLDVPVTLSVLLDRPSRWHEVGMALPQPLLRHAMPVAALGEYRDPRSDLFAVAPEPPRGGSLPRRAARGIGAYAVALGSALATRVRSELEPLGATDSHGSGAEAWPVGCARLVLTRGLYGTVPGEEPDPGTRRSVARWARAVTRRRVGVALGGGGALSFTGAAMLLGLIECEVPIDMISGTSFGTVVGAFYAVGGAPALRRLEGAWPSLYTALLNTTFNNISLGVWLEMQIGVVKLAELAVPLFPVATLARTSHEWDIRGGDLGAGVQSSGSLPPFAPTIHGRLRLLDGGFSADVPCRVLSDEGADLVIAVNPFPPPTLQPPAGPWVPFLSRTLEELNPLKRIVDLTRGYQMLWRLGAQSQLSYADVVFTAEDSTVQSFDFWDGQGIVDRTLASAALRAALARATSRWRAMAAEPQRLPTRPGDMSFVPRAR